MLQHWSATTFLDFGGQRYTKAVFSLWIIKRRGQDDQGSQRGLSNCILCFLNVGCFQWPQTGVSPPCHCFVSAYVIYQWEYAMHMNLKGNTMECLKNVLHVLLGCRHPLWNHSLTAWEGQGCTADALLQIPEQTASGWRQGEGRPPRQLLSRVEIQPLGAEGQKSGQHKVLPQLFRATSSELGW